MTDLSPPQPTPAGEGFFCQLTPPHLWGSPGKPGKIRDLCRLSPLIERPILHEADLRECHHQELPETRTTRWTTLAPVK
jgi:hypothetical protein